VVVEEIVVFEVRAVAALQAADEENGNSHRYQYGENVRVSL
jgi:hypothetical protein